MSPAEIQARVDHFKSVPPVRPSADPPALEIFGRSPPRPPTRRRGGPQGGARAAAHGLAGHRYRTLWTLTDVGVLTTLGRAAWGRFDANLARSPLRCVRCGWPRLESAALDGLAVPPGVGEVRAGPGHARRGARGCRLAPRKNRTRQARRKGGGPGFFRRPRGGRALAAAGAQRLRAGPAPGEAAAERRGGRSGLESDGRGGTTVFFRLRRTEGEVPDDAWDAA
jgi:hypothetical protein